MSPGPGFARTSSFTSLRHSPGILGGSAIGKMNFKGRLGKAMHPHA